MSETNIHRIFISYARRDGRDLAYRLLDHLKRAGYDVWLDTSEIEGGASWSSEIEQAIERCDITLALLSEGSFVSEICRAEQLRTLRKGKRVIPVLVQSSTERPLYLEHLQYRDFSDDSKYDQTFNTLLSDLASGQVVPLPESSRQTIISAPPLPPYFIPRPEELVGLRHSVIGDNTDRQIALTALRGMGGIGKSVLATALCHDDIIQAAFPDGIIWVPIGRTPGNLTEQFKLIGTKLGDSPGYYTSENTALDRLRALLSSRAVLIVLDDVWEIEHVEPFRFEVPRCRTLFTTRDSSIALACGATEVRLDTLKPDQALALLQEWAGHDDPSMPEIVERLSYLPLALKLAGARLREGMSGKDWLNTFKHVSQMKLGRRAIGPHDNLEMCFDLSVQQLLSEDQLLYYSFGVFPEDVPIPEHTVERMWQQIRHGLSEYDAAEIILDLARLALIERNVTDRTVLLHDLLHDYTRTKLGARLGQTHSDLLAAYNPANKPWWQVSHDGYLYYHLGYHLTGAGRREEFLRLLIQSPDWMEAKYEACAGDGSYVADLDMVIPDFRFPFTEEQLLVLTQLWTAHQVVNARVNTYSDLDLKTLTWIGRKGEALNHARLRTEARKRFDSLIAIYSALSEKGLPDYVLLDEAWAVAREIQDGEQRSEALSTLALLSAQAGRPNQIEAIYTEAEVAVLSVQNEMGVASAWRALALVMSQIGFFEPAKRFFEKANAATEIIKHDWNRTESQVILTKALSQARYIDMARSVALTISDLEKRTLALIPLIRILAETARLAEAEAIIQDMENVEQQVVAFIELSETLVGLTQTGESLDVLRKALVVAKTIEISEKRAVILANLAVAFCKTGFPDKTKPLLNEIDEIAQALQGEEEQDIVRRSLADALAKIGHFDHAATIANTIQSDYKRGQALKILVELLAQARHFEQATITAQIIPDMWLRAEAVSILILSLSDAQRFDDARAMVPSIQDNWKRAETLITLAVALSKAGHVTDAQIAVESIHDLGKRGEGYSAIAATLANTGNFSEAQRALKKASIATRAVRNDWSWIETTSMLAITLAANGHFEAVQRLAVAIPDPLKQAEILSRLTTTLAESGHIEEGEEIAQHLQNDGWRAAALSAVAAALVAAGRKGEGRKVFDKAIESARSVWDDFWGIRPIALRAVAIALAESGLTEEAKQIFNEALSAALIIENNSQKAAILKTLAVALMRFGHIESSINAVRAIRMVQIDENRVEALSEIAMMLSQTGHLEEAKSLFLEAESEAQAIKDDLGGIRTTALCALARSLFRSGQVSEADRIVNEALTDMNVISSERRATALSNVVSVLVEMGYLDRAEAIFNNASGVIQMIQDVGLKVSALGALADIFAQMGHFDRAYMLLHTHTIDGFLQELAKWHVSTGRLKADLPIVLVREALRIVGWMRSDWNEVYAVLSSL